MNVIQPKRIGMVCRGKAEDVTVLGRLIGSVEERVEVILEAGYEG
jgi:hypothetical protein